MADAYMQQLDNVVAQTIAPAAIEVDRAGRFPRDAIDALGRAGLLGLVSARDVGGHGQGLRAAALVVERLGASAARRRWSSACTTAPRR